jgi:hypothetical protein
MRINGERVTTPKCCLKPEYKKAAQIGWDHFHKPTSEWTDKIWNFAFSILETPEGEEIPF